MKRKYGLTPIERIERRRIVVGECWEVGLSPNKPYPQIKIGGRNEAVHRVVFQHVKGEVPDGQYILHHCDNPRCHNPKHLYLGTLSQNMEDMWRRGRHRKPVRRIDEQRVLLLHAEGKSQKEVAAEVGCSQTAVSKIMRSNGKSRGRHTSFNKHRSWETRKK